MRCLKLLSVVPIFAFCSILSAQVQTSKPAIAIDDAFVQKEFGSSCTMNKAMAPSFADLNGDGVEDVVIPARCKDPMMDQGQNGYVVIDPYFAFYGYGNPTVTTQYTTELPEDRSLVLLIIHGTGQNAWYSTAEKQKFLIVNLPYKRVAVKKIKFKKKIVMAVFALETGTDEMTSAIVWDGKKYRYLPVGSSME